LPKQRAGIQQTKPFPNSLGKGELAGGGGRLLDAQGEFRKKGGAKDMSKSALSDESTRGGNGRGGSENQGGVRSQRPQRRFWGKGPLTKSKPGRHWEDAPSSKIRGKEGKSKGGRKENKARRGKEERDKCPSSPGMVPLFKSNGDEKGGSKM